MASDKHLTWRIQQIPAAFDEVGLRKCFHSDDMKYIDIKSLVPDVSNYDGTGTLTATVLFSPPEAREPRIVDNEEDFLLDKAFIGFTPLNRPSEDVCADIIAVTGLAGHAFGSWAHSAKKMWLRDYLPIDIQNRARILIYGYESQLHGENAARSIVSDFSNRFIQELMILRDHASCRDRPIILIGHSLGALIIKQAITDLDPSIRSRLPVRTVLFFGAPHNGLDGGALKTLVKGSPPESLIADLERGSSILRGLSERFKNTVKDISVHSYYESRPTKTVAKDDRGNWQRIGERRMMVLHDSAVLNEDREKTRTMVDGDHREIVKLRRGQGGVYPSVLHIIKEALQSAPEQFAVASRVSELKQSETPQTDQNVSVATSEYQEQEEQYANKTREQEEEEYEDEDEESNEQYDNQNLVCDGCYNVFPKTDTHYHCFICDDGNFNICQTCNDSRESCPGNHDLLERRLGSPEAWGSESESGSDDEDWENTITCDVCSEVFRKDQVHFHCVICNDGQFDVCLPCRKLGKICPGRHKMVKRQLPIIETPNMNAAKSSSAQFSSKGDESTTTYCDTPGCNCSLPKREGSPSPQLSSRKSETPLATRDMPKYCDIPECDCNLPKREKSPLSQLSSQKSQSSITTKSITKYCDIPGCNCSLPKREESPSSEPFPEKSESPAANRDTTRYCDDPDCNCSLPKRGESPSAQLSSKQPQSPETNRGGLKYCDDPDCECSLPKRGETSSPQVSSKPSQSPETSRSVPNYCEDPNCDCSLPKREKPSLLKFWSKKSKS